ncbi:MAG: hypothetical protein LJE89_13205 [Deltaproteobacteria bacterium]|nr:hypothetical protein [Deltaproteobacteria bacterium]
MGGSLDTFAYPKRYDRHDFRGYCLVVIAGGDDPLKRSFDNCPNLVYGSLAFFLAILHISKNAPPDRSTFPGVKMSGKNSP